MRCGSIAIRVRLSICKNASEINDVMTACAMMGGTLMSIARRNKKTVMRSRGSTHHADVADVEATARSRRGTGEGERLAFLKRSLDGDGVVKVKAE
jgi:hypothetical protein